jgi:hypothetical protein
MIITWSFVGFVFDNQATTSLPQAHLWGSNLLPIVLVFLWARHDTWRRDIYIVTALASLLIAATFWTGGRPTGGDLLTSHLLP